MKKYLKYLMVVLLATICMSLTACGSDDEEDPKDPTGKPNSEIVGKWKVIANDPEDGWVDYIFEFKKSGRLTIADEYGHDDQYFRYSFSDQSSIYMIYDEDVYADKEEVGMWKMDGYYEIDGDILILDLELFDTDPEIWNQKFILKRI